MYSMRFFAFKMFESKSNYFLTAYGILLTLRAACALIAWEELYGEFLEKCRFCFFSGSVLFVTGLLRLDLKILQTIQIESIDKN